MTPFYERDGITIFCGDCLEILPKLTEIDSLISDVPYGMNMDTDSTRFSGGHRDSIARRGMGKDWGSGIINDDKPFGPSHLLNYRRVVLFGYQHFAYALPVGSVLVWLKRFDAAFGTFLSDAELAWMNTGCGVYCFRDLSMTAEANNRLHPTQKPLPLMRWVIGKAQPAGLICDPYCGSGSTLVAAKELGYRAIGIEIVEDYCHIAVDRLRQPSFFSLPTQPAKVEAEQVAMTL